MAFSIGYMPALHARYAIRKTRAPRDIETANAIPNSARAIIDHHIRLSPHSVYTIENPSTSLFKDQDAVRGLPSQHIDYCCWLPRGPVATLPMILSPDDTGIAGFHNVAYKGMCSLWH